MKALILIDYINDICDPKGKFASCAKMIQEEEIVTKLNLTLNKARAHNYLIIWVKVGFDKSYCLANLNSPIFSRAKEHNALLINSWGCELLKDINYEDNELIIYKHAVNPFHGTPLDHILRANNINEVLLAGVSTEVAIQSAVRDAHDKGYRVSLIADLCASGNLSRHESSLEMLTYLAKVITSHQI